MMDKPAQELYLDHQPFHGTSKGLMIPDEWRYKGRLSVAAGLLTALHANSVLDLGCGYGELSECVPPSGHYVGVDFTPWVVDEARKRYPQRTFVESNLESYSPGRPVDTTVLLGVLATMEGEAAVHRLMSRVCRFTTGYVVVSYLEPSVYRGKLYAHSLDELARIMDGAALCGPVWCPGDDSNRAVVFEV